MRLIECVLFHSRMKDFSIENFLAKTPRSHKNSKPSTVEPSAEREN